METCNNVHCIEFKPNLCAFGVLKKLNNFLHVCVTIQRVHMYMYVSTSSVCYVLGWLSGGTCVLRGFSDNLTIQRGLICEPHPHICTCS